MVPMQISVILRAVIATFRFLALCQLKNKHYSGGDSQAVSAAHG
jgi:hypothetical protein